MIGQELGHYRIEEKLGEGGMGVVYRAHDMHLGRPVAIKVLSPEAVSNPERKRRFVQEARTASALNHPNILHIYDIDQANGVDFMAMEFIPGRTLDQLFGRDGLPLGEALKYAGQIASALARAHEAGIVHRDVKPANVIVTADGLVKVLDFGLAKLTEPVMEIGDSSVTKTTYGPRTEAGAIIGTIQYMSPEQAEGKSIDARSDIFSFGTLLYEMVTGRRAFHGDSPIGTLSAILTKEPVPPSEILTGIPRELEQIISRCLRKEPERRFQSMGELKAALEEVEESLRAPSAIKPPPPPDVAPPDGLRGRRKFLWAAVAVIGAGVLAVAIPWNRFQSSAGTRGKLIAILPFQTAATDPAGRAFAEGLRETLGRELCRLDQYQQTTRVLPPGDVHGDAARGPVEARKKLGADMVLTGTLTPANESVRLSLNLVDTATAQDIDRVETELPLRNSSALVSGLVRAAAKVLRLNVPAKAGETLSSGNTNVPDAYVSYVEAYGYLKHADRGEDLDRAAGLFQQAVGKDPAYARAQTGLAASLWARSLLTHDQDAAEKAGESARRAVAAGANLPEAHLVLGKIYAGTGKPQEAVEQFQRMLQLDPLSIDAYTNIGEAYEAQGRLADSEGAYRKLVDLWPNYLVPYSHLAAFYVRQGRYKDAEPMFRKVVDLAPENASGYRNLGAVYHLLGRTDEAAAMMKKALSIEPTALGYTNLGTFYFFQGHYSDAVPLMEKAVEMDPSEYVYWGNLGDAYRWTPDFKKRAPDAYARAIKLAEQQPNVNPGDATFHATLAVYYAKLPDTANALAEIARARRLAPMNPKVLFKSALVYEITGKREQAIGALELALQSGYSRDEVRTEPELAELRKDPRYRRLDKAPAPPPAANRTP